VTGKRLSPAMEDMHHVHDPFAFTNDQVLRRRAEIREQNAAQPRCAGCGNDLVDRDGKCAISAEEEEQYCGEFVCGDLFCF
jgi:hypothetical protein